MKKLWIICLFSFLLFSMAMARGEKALLQELLEEDQAAIEALVLYPEATRSVILEAAAYPGALVRMHGIREKTETRFQTIIAPFREEEQERFYDVARFPQLVDELVEGGKKSKGEIQEILKDFPEEVHENADKVGRNHYQELVEIQRLLLSSEQAFQTLTRDYPKEVRDNLTELLKMPEVMDILMDNFQSTVLLGSIYERDPRWVLNMADSIQQEVAKKRAKELADWKANLESDPDAMKEMEAAAEAFAKEKGYKPKTYRQTLSEREFAYRSSYPYYPYTYWFGHPYWYADPIWYPRPYWYYWGGYYGPGGKMIIVDFPSWYFLDWYFVDYHHFYYYSHLTNQYLVHQERHRTSTFPPTVRIRTWENQHRNSYKRDWLKDDGRRVHRLRDYGSREGIATTRTRLIPTYRTPTYKRNEPATRVQPSRSGTINQRPTINRAPEYQRQRLNKMRPQRSTRVTPAPTRRSPKMSPTTPARKPTTIKKRRN